MQTARTPRPRLNLGSENRSMACMPLVKSGPPNVSPLCVRGKKRGRRLFADPRCLTRSGWPLRRERPLLEDWSPRDARTKVGEPDSQHHRRRDYSRGLPLLLGLQEDLTRSSRSIAARSASIWARAGRASFHARWTTQENERSSRRASAAISCNILAGK